MTFVQQVANSNGWSSNARGVRHSPDKARAKEAVDAGPNLVARNRRSALLNQVVEAEIIPRLAIARAKANLRVEGEANLAATEDDTSELVRRLMGRDDGSAWTFIELLEMRGATPASLYLGVVSQAARRLGELWEEDRCDFTQVTISLGRLQQLVRALSPSFQTAAIGQSGHADTVLLLPAPGEQHTFGLVILAEFFQREGWLLAGGPISSGYHAADLVRNAWVDIAGFSIGSSGRLDGLARCIRAVRKASRNRNIGVMVGGPLFLRHPELVTRVGADTAATDALSAIRQARGLLAMRAAAD